MKNWNRKWVIPGLLLLSLTPAAITKNGGKPGARGVVIHIGKVVRNLCRKVRCSAVYLLGAGLVCLGMMVFQSGSPKSAAVRVSAAYLLLEKWASAESMLLRLRNKFAQDACNALTRQSVPQRRHRPLLGIPTKYLRQFRAQLVAVATY